MEERTSPRVGTPFGRNRLLQVLTGGYAALWLALAMAPLDRATWLLENLLVFAAAIALAATHRRFVFSNFSYASIFVFLTLHAVGSHYTYSAVPLGDWARDAFGLTRNHYDRVVHFAFGLLLAVPMRELMLRRVHARGAWRSLLPLLAIVTASSLYEILEWAAARATRPEVGLAYVGAQGDIWDGQKDMALALLGGILAMTISELHLRRTGHEPWTRRIRRAHPSAQAQGSDPTG